MVELEDNDVGIEEQETASQNQVDGSHFNHKETWRSKPFQVTNTEFAAKVQMILKKLQNLSETQNNRFPTLNLPVIADENCIGMSERDSAVSSIKSMQKFYNYGSDTLASAVSYLDMFLNKVKVKRRYLSCVTAAAFYLSVKMNEETEYHPSASDLASLHRNSWKATDLKRMEKVFLEKLDWNLHPSVTCLAFLQLIYKLLCILEPSIDDTLFSTMVQQSEILINYAFCVRYKPLTLAVCVTHKCLKDAGLSTLSSNCLLLNVQGICKIRDSEVLDCQCAISHQIELYSTHPSSHPPCLSLPKLIVRPNLVQRPSYYCPTDLPVIKEVPCSCETNSEDVEYQPDVPYSVCPAGHCGLILPTSYKQNKHIVCLLPDTTYSGSFSTVYGSVQ